MCFVLLGFKVLIASNGGAKMEGELFIKDPVHSVSVGRVSVQDGDLEWCEWGTVIVHGYGLQNLGVNGVTMAIGSRNFGMVTLDSVCDIGGDDEAVSGGIGDQDPVIVIGERIVHLPSGTWVIATYPL